MSIDWASLVEWAVFNVSKSAFKADLSSSVNFSANSLICFSVWKIRLSAIFTLSTNSLSIRSDSAFASASAFILSISSLDSWEPPSIRILFSFPLALSLADTDRIPLASMSNVTSTWGIPLGAGMIPSRWNLPNERLSLAIGLSPCRTWISTDGWLSAAVENVSDLRVGIVVLASINLVITLPIVSIPRDSGVTSKSNTSVIPPLKTAPWIAAPKATTSSGLTDLFGFLPVYFSNASCKEGILVEPPTRITSSRSDGFKPALFKADLAQAIALSTRLEVIWSNLALVNCFTKCKGIPSWAVI